MLVRADSIIIELTNHDAETLRAVLGKLSDSKMKELELTSEHRNVIITLYSDIHDTLEGK